MRDDGRREEEPLKSFIQRRGGRYVLFYKPRKKKLSYSKRSTSQKFSEAERSCKEPRKITTTFLR